MIPGIFLDRDGVLVEEVHYPRTGETEAPLDAADVRLLPRAAEALVRAQAAGFARIIISNQGGYAKGKTSLRALWLAHLRFVALLNEAGAAIDDALYSYGHPDGVAPHFSGASLDRKPGPYNLLIAAAKHDIDLNRSWMVGDRETDVECGRAVGVRTIRISKLEVISAADHVAADIGAAANVILKGS